MINIHLAELKLDDISRAVFRNEDVAISEDSIQKVNDSFHFLQDFARGKIIYGINTGFGPMAQHKIGEADQIKLQYNLIRSHASGAGALLEPIYIKASMIARLNTLSLGYSGVHFSAIEVLLSLINHNVFPEIYEHGGVGASGDLVQLAHLALVMIGEGEVVYEGKIRPTVEVFKELGITPMKITLREGLAIMNGTSVMTGIGTINAIYAQRAIEWSTMATIMICEMIGSYDDYFSEELNASKKHKGQQQIAKTIRKHLGAGQYSRKREQQLYAGLGAESVIDNKVQEYYSIRCVPQISGIILETVQECQVLLEEEINSANDNPIVHVESKNVYHGGNFHGDYVSFEMDKLKIAITKLSMLAERQLNFLMNPALNNILPPFVNLGKPGLNFGMQGIQFTATSTTAENQMLSNPMYVHSIPNNNDNQDIVSMGTNAALCAKKVIENTFEVLAIEMLAIVQALDFLGKTEGLCPSSRETYKVIRDRIPVFSADSPLHSQLKTLKTYMMANCPLEIEPLSAP